MGYLCGERHPGVNGVSLQGNKSLLLGLADLLGFDHCCVCCADIPLNETIALYIQLDVCPVTDVMVCTELFELNGIKGLATV